MGFKSFLSNLFLRNQIPVRQNNNQSNNLALINGDGNNVQQNVTIVNFSLLMPMGKFVDSFFNKRYFLCLFPYV